MAVHTDVSSLEKLKAQLDHPTEEAIRSRALEVFGDSNKAIGWLGDPRLIFDGRSPNEIIEVGEPRSMREVLVILGQIENGIVG